MWQSGLKSEDGNTFSHCSHSWPCFHAAEIIFDTCPQLSEGEQSECVRERNNPKEGATLTFFCTPSVSSSLSLPQRLLEFDLKILSFHGMLLYYFEQHQVVYSWGQKRHEPPHRKSVSFETLWYLFGRENPFRFFFFFFFCCIKRASACFSEFKVFAFHWSQTASSKHWMSWENFFTR